MSPMSALSASCNISVPCVQLSHSLSGTPLIMGRGSYKRLPVNSEDGKSANPQSRSAVFKRRVPYVLTFGGLVILTYLVYFFSVSDALHEKKIHESQLSLAEMRRGMYLPRSKNVNWLPDGVDGEFLIEEHGWSIAKWPKREARKILNATVVTYDNEEEKIERVKLNKQRSHALVSTELQKHWRHSSFARYWLVDLSTNIVSSVGDGLLSIVEWSPQGDKIAYVREHDIYTLDIFTGKTERVTADGGDDVFNGIPDWVYEEEVFSGDSAIWWSAEGSYLAFLRTNDSLVPEFPIPYFLPAVGGHLSAYPTLSQLKYPKPGYDNPEVSLHIYGKDNNARSVRLDTDIKDILITECVWIGDSQLLVKVMDREGDSMEVHLVDAEHAVDSLVRKSSRSASSEGWFEVTHNTRYVPADADNGRPQDGYIDTVTVDGFNHLGYFSPPDSPEPLYLTSGQWEVDDVQYAVNLHDNEVYFSSTIVSPIERSICRASLLHPDNEVDIISKEESGIFTAKYSPDGTFALISHNGPSLPTKQTVLKLNATAKYIDGDVIESNDALNQLLQSRNLGEIRYGQVEVAPGISVNYREILPSNFDPNKKHPLLFYNYGGPGSQMVQKQLTLDFQRIFAETHNAVVVTVDPRGTGFMGKAFRSVVRDNLGIFESHDVIEVAKQWNKREYIDESTTAIWGWSYGGFLTLKVLEQDKDLVFKYGVSVAPVTDWKLYDSIYTERYMHTPNHNKAGYVTASIVNVTNIARHERFLVMHGTGDDNVHFQNTLSLLDQLDVQGVENYDVHIFPDSDHSISFHNANTIVYDKIDSWLKTQQERSGTKVSHSRQ